ncbi:hypothetical protein MJT46_016016 [Ovis ammon polii x Ovis aries]|nr:hypothetical protein MJT46_016016 [Ovis ammon polii x Ovis aries]
MLRKKRSHCSEKLTHHKEEQPSPTAARESTASKEEEDLVDRSAFLEKNSPCLVALWFETHVLCYGFEKGKPIPQGASLLRSNFPKNLKLFTKLKVFQDCQPVDSLCRNSAHPSVEHSEEVTVFRQDDQGSSDLCFYLKPKPNITRRGDLGLIITSVGQRVAFKDKSP